MASSKVVFMPCSTPPPPPPSTSSNSDLNSLSSLHHLLSPSSQMISDFTATASDLQQRLNVDDILRFPPPDGVASSPPPLPTDATTLLDAAEISLIDAAGAIEDDRHRGERKTVEDVWREIVSGKTSSSERRKECKVETADEMMTLEDFLAKAGAGGDQHQQQEVVEEDVKVEVSSMQMSGSGGGGGVFGFDHQLVQCSYAAAGMGGVSVMGYGNGGGMEVMGGGVRGKRRGGPILEPLDKAAQQRQRRMIKNRESAARSRERKQVALYISLCQIIIVTLVSLL